MPLSLITILLVLFLSACTPALSQAVPSPAPLAASADPAAQLSLRRLQLLKLESGAQCPRAHARQVARAYGVALGDGPAYATGFSNDSILQINLTAPTESPFYGNEWSGAKVLWFIDPAYRGPILIRGGQLDGPDRLRFDMGAEPASEIAIAAAAGSSSEWRSIPSYVRLRSPGCYMIQVDGLNFTEAIIFEAHAQP